MKTILKSITLSVLVVFAVSCKKDEGTLPDIKLKTGTGYISEDATLPAGTSVKIGIEADKTEDKDVLKKFDISESVNGADATSIFNMDLDASEEDHFEYDYTTTVDTISGQTNKYIFTITNRDGLVNHAFLTLTVQ